jgi:N-succinyldiaminopimelate aminotransferase
VLLATIETGDEVIVTDPTYAGLVNRVRLAGSVPRFAAFGFAPGAPWTLDRRALASAVGPRTRAILLMSPSMPSGGYLDESDWSLVAELCIEHDLLLILDAAMERLLFDGRRPIHPAGLTGMASRTITVGSASKELRMIGWRVGWIVAPEAYLPISPPWAWPTSSCPWGSRRTRPRSRSSARPRRCRPMWPSSSAGATCC